MRCTRCQKDVPSSYLKCPSCGQGFHGINTPSSFAHDRKPSSEASTFSATPASDSSQLAGNYCPFWPRVGAYILDNLIILIPTFIIGFFVGFFEALSDSSSDIGVLKAQLAAVVFWLAYEAIFISGSWAATPGKRLLDIRVLGAAGEKISFWRAVGRALSKLVSAIPLMLGFLLVLFTKRKQALHDFMASTIVVR